MRNANIKGIYFINKAPNPIVLGYLIEAEVNGVKQTANLSNTKMLTEPYLKSLNQNGWLFNGVGENKETKTIFPKFRHVDPKLSTVPVIDLLKLDKTKQMTIAGQLTKDVKFDLSVANKYKEQLHPYPPASENTVVKPTVAQTAPQKQPEPVKPVTQVQPTTQMQQPVKPVTPVQPTTQMQQPVKPVQQPTTPMQEPTSPVTQPTTPMQQPVDNSATTLDFKWVPEVNLPVISKIPDSLSYLTDSVQKGIYKRRDYSEILKAFNITKINTKEEYDKFITDFLNGNIDLDNDNRVWMNLNYFVAPSLLHSSLTDYRDDKMLREFIKKKSNSFTVDNIFKLEEMLKRFPSPLLTEKTLPGYNDLVQSVYKNPEGTEIITTYVQYFIDEPLEGFNHVYDVSGMILRPTIEIPSLRNKSIDSYTMDVAYVPKINGKADFSSIKCEYEIFDEYETYVSVKLKKIKPLLKFRAKMTDDLNVDYMSNGTFKVTTRMGSTKLDFSISNYFNIRSKIDSSVILPYPKDKKFENMGEHDYILFNRLYSKINKIIKIHTPETEYDVLNKIGYSPLEIETYLTKQMGKENYQNLKAEVEDMVSLDDDIEDDADEILIKMASDVQGFRDSDLLLVILGLRKNRVMSPNAGRVYQSLMTKLKPSRIVNIMKMAINYGYSTPEDIHNELEKVKTTGEPITFNTPITFNWKVEPTEFLDYLSKIEKELFEQRMSGMKNTIKVVGFITNFSGTKDIGVVYELESKVKKFEGDNGTYIDTFHRLKHIIKDGGFMATNGYVMEDGFIPFNKDEVIPRTSIANGIKQYKHLDYFSKWKQDSFLHYFINVFQASLKEQLMKSKENGNETLNDSDFIEPPTPYEIYFGLDQSTIDGSIEKVEKVEEPKEEIKEEDKLENIEEVEPVKEETHQQVEEPKKVQPTITEDIETVSGEIETPPVVEYKEETSANKTKVYGNLNSTKWVDDFSGAQYTFTLTGGIYANVELSQVNPNQNLIGAVMVVKDLNRGFEQLSKISLVDLYKLVQSKQFSCKNGRVSVDSLEVEGEFKTYLVIDKELESIRVISKKPIPTSIQFYEGLLQEAIAESDKTGNQIVLPEPPISRINKSSDKNEKVEERLMEVVNSKNTVLGDIYKKATKDRQKFVTIVGVTPTHIFYYPAGNQSDKVFSYALEKLINEKDKFSAFGFVKLLNGNFIIENANGKYLMLDSNLNEI